MSIQTDVTTSLAAVAGGRVYPQAAPQDAILPFVVYRIPSMEPLMTLMGYEGTTRYTIEFICVAKTYSEALSTALAAQSAIDISFPGAFREPPPGNEYLNEADEFVEFVVCSFWHT